MAPAIETMDPISANAHLLEPYINYSLSVDLDSTDAFEGPEKLLEVWFSKDENSLPKHINKQGLRSIPRLEWEKMLDLVQCKVLSVVSSEKMDSYLLSESSMFVFPHKVILKTCGTTTTLIGLPQILKLAFEIVGFNNNDNKKFPWRLFYSRKSFMFPSKQKHPHKTWADEIKFLNKMFDNQGNAYLLGRLNSDHWYLYTLCIEDESKSTNEKTVSEKCFEFQDQTLELLMTHLDVDKAQQFVTDRIAGDGILHYNSDGEHVEQSTTNGSDVEESTNPTGAVIEDTDSESDASVLSTSTSVSSISVNNKKEEETDPGHKLGTIVSRLTGMDSLYPASTTNNTTIVDSFSFTPCGYSANAIVDSSHYYTVHVTPENGWSYASFETNVPASKYGTTNLEVIKKVLGIFKPGRFCLTFFQSKENENENGIKNDKLISFLKDLNGYKRTEKILYDFDTYELLFLNFEKI